MKKIVSVCLALALLLSISPLVTIQGDAIATKKVKEIFIPWKSNPLYEGYVDRQDLGQGSRGMSTMSASQQTEYLSEQEAAAYLRSQMVARNNTITVGVVSDIYSTDAQFNAFTDELILKAISHTGEPDGGDYLRWQYGGYQCDITYYVTESEGYYTLTYGVLYYTTAEQEAEVDHAVEELLETFDLSGMTDYEKILAIYDYICTNVEYDYDALENPGEDLLTFTAYGALIENSCVCQGYANLFYRLALEAGVDNRLIAGISLDQNHGWNIVELGGKYYNLDSTWDAGTTEYSYFLKCEENFVDHTRNTEYETEEFHASYPMAEQDYAPNSADIITGTCGENVTWVLENGELTIRGEGALEYPDGSAPWIDYREQISSLSIGEGITSLRFSAFAGYCSLTNVVLPSSLEEINSYAFQGCNKLESLAIPSNVTAIAMDAFDRCEALTTFIVSEDNEVFDSIDGVLFLEGGRNLLRYPEGKNASATYSIPQGTMYIGDSAFDYSKLTGIEIPDTVTTISRWAFGNCYEMEQLIIPSSVTDIGEYIFANGYNMKQIIFCGDMPHMDSNVFGGMTAVCYYPAGNETWDEFSVEDYGGTMTAYSYESIDDVPPLEGIGDGSGGESGDDGEDSGTDGGAGGSGSGSGSGGGSGSGSGFVDDETDVTEDSLSWSFADGILTISGEGAMKDYYHLDKPWAEYKGQITSVVLESGITSIGKCAFADFDKIESVSIPDTVTRIREGAFNGCDNLRDISLPEGLTVIGLFAFHDCASLESINLPDGLIKIDGDAFSGTHITEIFIPSTVQIMGNYAVGNEKMLEITVDAENQYFTSEDGVLFSKNMTTLICYPAGRESKQYSVPEGVTELAVGAFAYAPNLVEVTIPDTVINWGGSIFAECTNLKEVNIPDGVTAIGGYTFYRCSSLETVSIPDSVTSIQTRAFSEASSLKEIVIPDSVTTIGNSAFHGCDNLKELVLPDSVEAIGSTSFGYCDNLEKIYIGAGLSTIGDEAFYCCYKLAEISVDEDNVYFATDDRALFSKDMSELLYYFIGNESAHYTIPDTVTTIGAKAFSRNMYLQSVLIPSGVISIGEEAFAASAALHTVDIASGLTELGTAVFASCESLCQITLPDTIRIIGNSAFSCCSVLEKLDIPGQVELIGAGAFDQCASLKEIAIPDGITSIEDHTFFGCTNLTEVIIPSGVTSIGVHAFGCCSGLKTVIIPNSVTTIGNAAFHECTSLTEIIIPDSVTQIGSSFSHSGLIEIVIPASVKKIDYNAFCSCDSLKRIQFLGDAPEFGYEIFCDTVTTAYYPANNDTWTEDILQNHGGTITWLPYYPVMEEGTDTEIEAGEKAEIHIDADHTTFVAVYLDDKLVDPSNYTVTEGSTIITFTAEYLATLSEGDHQVTVEFQSGAAYTVLTVAVPDCTSGDLNLDGNVDSDDLTALARHVGGIEAVEGQALTNADVNGDGQVNSDDLTKHARYVGGIITDWNQQ